MRFCDFTISAAGVVRWHAIDADAVSWSGECGVATADEFEAGEWAAVAVIVPHRGRPGATFTAMLIPVRARHAMHAAMWSLFAGVDGVTVASADVCPGAVRSAA